ncbi:MAG: hypothetical protein IPH43_01265 [Xanthomonadales bacterium]|uniref:hypothetical protein n=1 Tax=Dokdonella sp. TaxID=2291710 RepID=UPI002B54A66F|nr:hypothetical protein [Xanthomonadales bacterium]MBK7211284.1 hypothetical protein [Xanthomonadales bacterium]HRA88564.1 hypothetical protein [Planctomycetaceae bacterium]
MKYVLAMVICALIYLIGAIAAGIDREKNGGALRPYIVMGTIICIGGAWFGIVGRKDK